MRNAEEALGKLRQHLPDKCADIPRSYAVGVRAGDDEQRWHQHTWRTFETIALMSHYTYLVLDEADDADFRASLKDFGISNCSLSFAMLEETMDDGPLSMIQWKEKAFELKSARLPCAHPAVALAMLRLAHAYVNGDRMDFALPLLHQCLPLIRRLPCFHTNIPLTLLLRAACLVKTNDFASAAADVAEAQLILESSNTEAIAVTADLVLCAQQFRTSLTSLGSSKSRDACVAACVSAVQRISTDESCIRKGVINRSWDAEHHSAASCQLATLNLWKENLRNPKASSGCRPFVIGRLKLPSSRQISEQHQAQQKLQLQAAIDEAAKMINLMEPEMRRRVGQRGGSASEGGRGEGGKEGR